MGRAKNKVRIHHNFFYTLVLIKTLSKHFKKYFTLGYFCHCVNLVIPPPPLHHMTSLLYGAYSVGGGTTLFGVFHPWGTEIWTFKGSYLLNYWSCSLNLYTKIIALICSTIQHSLGVLVPIGA